MQVTRNLPRPVRPRPVVLLIAVVLGAGLSMLAAAPAQAGSVGYVRLAHLSPDTPEVDVYLAKVGSSTFAQKVFPGVGYGVVSQYQIVPTGSYRVSMRLAGAPPTTNPVLTTLVTVAAGKAFTVAGVGRNVDLGLRVLADDLSRPDAGKAKVRIIQASGTTPLLDVALPEGTPIATAVPFATTTPYRQVDPGTWALALKATGATAVSTVQCSFDRGDVYSLIVLDGPGGQLRAEARLDARGGSTVPVDGVPTGGGGTAARGPHALALVGLGGVVTLGLALLSIRLARLSRRRG